MNISELSQAELQVFADLVAQIALADRALSFDEVRELEQLSQEFGDRFGPMVAASRKKNVAQALDGVGRVERVEARQLMMTMLYDMAASDGFAEREERLLQAVHEAWTAAV